MTLAAELSLPGRLQSAAAARRHTLAWLREHSCPVDRDAAEQLVDELVSNALQHAGGQAVGMSLVLQPGRLRVEVRDPSRALPCMMPLSPTAESGRGMYLVDQLSYRWGADVLPTGKYVWFELALRPARTPTRPPQRRQSRKTATPRSAVLGQLLLVPTQRRPCAERAPRPS
ncbi:ATP-binding protein [Streptomyces humidus]